jgi:hypothetical protein
VGSRSRGLLEGSPLLASIGCLTRATLETRDRAQVFVDRAQVFVRHVGVRGPWHDLKQRAVKWRRQARPVRSGGARWMAVININAGSDDGTELRESEVTRRQTGLTRGQVARHDVREWTFCWKRAEIAPAAEVRDRVGHCLLAGIRISAYDILRLGARTVTAVAFRLRIDDVAAKADQVHIPAAQVERDRCDPESLIDSRPCLSVGSALADDNIAPSIPNMTIVASPASFRVRRDIWFPFACR